MIQVKKEEGCLSETPDVETSQGQDLIKLQPEIKLPSSCMTSMQLPLPPRLLWGGPHYVAQQPGHSADLPALGLRDTGSSLPQEEAGAGRRLSMQQNRRFLQRQSRLSKNRKAARESRLRKKEYIRCLEERVVALESKNKVLIGELQAMKNIYL